MSLVKHDAELLNTEHFKNSIILEKSAITELRRQILGIQGNRYALLCEGRVSFYQSLKDAIIESDKLSGHVYQIYIPRK